MGVDYSGEGWWSDFCSWCDKYLKNDDGTYSLYDNKRFNRHTNFREQLFVYEPVSTSTKTSIFSGSLGDLVKVARGEKISELENTYGVGGELYYYYWRMGRSAW